MMVQHHVPTVPVCQKKDAGDSDGTQIAHSYPGRFLDHCATCSVFWVLTAHHSCRLASRLCQTRVGKWSAQLNLVRLRASSIGGCSSAEKPPPGPGRADADERVHQINRWLSIIEVAKTTSKAGLGLTLPYAKTCSQRKRRELLHAVRGALVCTSSGTATRSDVRLLSRRRRISSAPTWSI